MKENLPTSSPTQHPLQSAVVKWLLRTKIPAQLSGERSPQLRVTLLHCILPSFLGGYKAPLPMQNSSVLSRGKQHSLQQQGLPGKKIINTTAPCRTEIRKKKKKQRQQRANPSVRLDIAETQPASPPQLLWSPNFRSKGRHTRSTSFWDCIYGSSLGSTMTHFKSEHSQKLLVLT